MKKLLFLSSAICIGISCCISSLSAQVDIVVHTVTPEGSWHTAPENIQKISFTDVGVSFLNKDKTSIHVPFDEFKKITFIDAITGIPQSEADPLSLSLFLQNDYLIVKGWNESQTTTGYIHSSNGALVQMNKNWNGQPIDISTLSPGVYLLSINNSTFKFCKP
ncbi:MAG: T9SS type A sorting domain-containing protein [Bacteroidales bacterium]